MTEPRSARRFSRFLFLALVVAALAGGWWWLTERKAQPTPVRAETLVAGPAAQVLAVNGQLMPGRTDKIGAPVLGQVTEVAIEEGDEIAKDQLLVRLDDTIARQAVTQAEATLGAARVDLEAKQRAWERAKALSDTVSTQTRENAEFAWRAAGSQVAQLEAALAQARQQFSLYRITSPSAGTVLAVDAEIGQVVGSSNVLVTVGDLSAPMVEADVDESYGVRLHPGLEARISPIGSEAQMDAHVDFVAPTVDPLTGSRVVRLTLDAPPEVQMPSGLTVSVNIVVERFDNVITVPRSAILDLDKAPQVMVIDRGRASMRAIKVRDWPSQRLIVREGLAAGDVLILAPQETAPGALVVAD
ncbi:MAG TPA: efflux RND transporter periplasmic adaptor subunit [Rhodobacterales bacterium]|nr:efflux RND transporter periplasmic adaptor subunit [Rhodobacterales bacterium]